MSGEREEIAIQILNIDLEMWYRLGTINNDGIITIKAAIESAGSTDPDAIRKALWNVQVKGVNGNIAFIKQGPAGKESAQNQPNIFIVKIDNGKISPVI